MKLNYVEFIEDIYSNQKKLIKINKDKDFKSILELNLEDKVWEKISEYEEILSEDFILLFKHRLNINKILSYKKDIDEILIYKLANLIDFDIFIKSHYVKKEYPYIYKESNIEKLKLVLKYNYLFLSKKVKYNKLYIKNSLKETEEKRYLKDILYYFKLIPLNKNKMDPEIIRNRFKFALLLFFILTIPFIIYYIDVVIHLLDKLMGFDKLENLKRE